MSHTDYVIRYEDLNKGGTKQKSFKTAEAREEWVEKQIDAGNIRTLAWSDPQ